LILFFSKSRNYVIIKYDTGSLEEEISLLQLQAVRESGNVTNLHFSIPLARFHQRESEDFTENYISFSLIVTPVADLPMAIEYKATVTIPPSTPPDTNIRFYSTHATPAEDTMTFVAVTDLEGEPDNIVYIGNYDNRPAFIVYYFARPVD